MSILKYWIYAARLHTLPLSISGIILSTLIAFSRGYWNILIFLYSCITSLILQILANYSNDYGDYIKGTDNNQRIGPKRTLQMGYISILLMKKAIILFSFLSFILSIILILESFDIKDIIVIFFFIILTFFGIYSAVAYTVGKNNYGYKGYADIFVFFFFGLVSLQCTYFLYTYSFDIGILILSMSIGCFSVAVLHLNNMRDIKNDKKNNKYTLAVKIGLKKSKLYYIFLILFPFFSGSIFVLINYKNFYQWLFLTLLIPIYIHLIKIITINNYEDFNLELKKIVFLNLFYTLLIGLTLFLN